MKCLLIRGKAGGNSLGVSSLVKPKGTQENGYNINLFKYVTENVNEDGNEHVNQVVSDNLYHMLKIECLA